MELYKIFAIINRAIKGLHCIFFDLRLNKLFTKQSRGWWFETQTYYDVTVMVDII